MAISIFTPKTAEALRDLHHTAIHGVCDIGMMLDAMDFIAESLAESDIDRSLSAMVFALEACLERTRRGHEAARDALGLADEAVPASMGAES